MPKKYTLVIAALFGLSAVYLLLDVPRVTSANSAFESRLQRSPIQIKSSSPQSQAFSVGHYPYAVAYDGTNIWVTNEFSDSVTVLQASNGAFVDYHTVGSHPTGITFDGTKTWVVNNGSGNVTVLRTSDRVFQNTVNVGSSPIAAAFDGTNVWVTNWGAGLGNSVSVINATTYANVGTYPVGIGPFAILFDGTNMWVANGDSTISVLRAVDGYHVMTPTVLFSGNGQGLAKAGNWIWATSFYSDRISALDAVTGQTVLSTTVGSHPFGVAYDGSRIFVVNQDSKSVSVLYAKNGCLLGTVPVGNVPQSIAFDGQFMWVTNLNDDNVSRISYSDIPTPTLCINTLLPMIFR